MPRMSQSRNTGAALPGQDPASLRQSFRRINVEGGVFSDIDIDDRQAAQFDKMAGTDIA
jgi:hypothetical protein